MQYLKLPGPNARAVVERDNAVISPSYPRDYPFVMDHGRGVEVWDVDGNRFLDFAAGIAVASTGHSHPQVVKAIQQQAEKFFHMGTKPYRRANMQIPYNGDRGLFWVVNVPPIMEREYPIV